MMSRGQERSDLRREAFLQVEDVENIQCSTCLNVAVEGSQYCVSCGIYWEDCRNGIFDQELEENF